MRDHTYGVVVVGESGQLITFGQEHGHAPLHFDVVQQFVDERFVFVGGDQERVVFSGVVTWGRGACVLVALLPGVRGRVCVLVALLPEVGGVS